MWARVSPISSDVSTTKKKSQAMLFIRGAGDGKSNLGEQRRYPQRGRSARRWHQRSRSKLLLLAGSLVGALGPPLTDWVIRSLIKWVQENLMT